MGRLLTLLALCLSFAAPAHALTPGQKRAVLGQTCPIAALSFTSGSPLGCAGRQGFVSSAATLSGTGATVMTALDSAGTLHDFASGALRITDRGLLVEPAATNLIPQSQAFTNAAWTASAASVTAAAAAAPDGATTAAKLAATGAFAMVSQTTGLVLSATSPYSVAIYLEAGTVNTVALDEDDGSHHAYATYTLTGTGSCAPGSVSGFSNLSCGIAAIGGGWYRAILNFTSTTGSTPVPLQIWVGGVNGTNYAPGYVYIWGAQIEAGALTTSYIPTASAAVTRSAETASLSYASRPSYRPVINFSTASELGHSAYAGAASPIDLGASGLGGWVGGYIARVAVNAKYPVPPLASAVGFNTLTFSTSSSFTSSTVDVGKTFGSGFQWYIWNWFGYPPDPAITLNGDGTLTMLSTVFRSNEDLASAGYAPSASPFYVGTAFGGGFYAEAEMSFNPALVNVAHGHPAFWHLPLETLFPTPLPAALWPGQASNYSNYVEADDFEYDYEAGHTFTTGLGNWYGINGVNVYGPTTFLFTDPAHNFSAYHRYGLLWVPGSATTNGSLTYFIDGVQIGTSQLYAQFTGQSPPPQAPWAFGVVDQQHLILILGTGTDSPLTIRSVNVWQASAANNMHN